MTLSQRRIPIRHVAVFLCLSNCILAGQAWAQAAPVLSSWSIRHTHDHVQGLDVSADWFWISAVDRRSKTGWIGRIDRRTLATVAERNITQGALYHAGGCHLSGKSLWIPIAEYRANSSARILELDAMTLAERRSFAVADHIGAVATDGRSAVLAANWDSRKIYRFSLDGELRKVVDFNEPLAIQDMKWIDGKILAGGTGIGARKGECLLYELEPATFAVVRRMSRRDDICYTHEGMAFFEGRFFFLPEDEPKSRVYVRELTGDDWNRR